MASVSEIIHDRAYVSRVLDVSINIGLTALLVISCLLILKPFVPLLVWGMIIAIASYPRFEKVKNSLGGRGGWAAVIWTLLLLLILIFPIFLLARGVVESGQNLIARIHDGTLSVPPPPAGIQNWPLIGAPLRTFRSLIAEPLRITSQVPSGSCLATLIATPDSRSALSQPCVSYSFQNASAVWLAR